MKKKLYDAYFTVEASFIIPMAFLLIILTLQYGFFCYEKSVSLQCCYLAALRTSNEWNLSGSEAENYAINEAEKLLEERMLYPIDKEINSDVSLLGIEVMMEGDMAVLFSEARGDLVENWKIDSEMRAGRMVPTEYIRKYHVIKDLGGENNGNN